MHHSEYKKPVVFWVRVKGQLRGQSSKCENLENKLYEEGDLELVLIHSVKYSNLMMICI